MSALCWTLGRQSSFIQLVPAPATSLALRICGYVLTYLKDLWWKQGESVGGKQKLFEKKLFRLTHTEK